MTPTEQQEPPMRSPRNDDWIEWTGGERKYADAAQTIGIRPKPTRADLIAQRAAKAAELADLDAQLAAMPETVRLYVYCKEGHMGGAWNASPRGATHYRDFILINGVPEGFVPVEGV